MVLENLVNLDVTIFLFLNKTLSNSILDFFFFYADKLPYVVYTSLILFSIIKNRNLAVLLMVLLAVTGIFVPMIKQAIGRERPYDALNDTRVLAEPSTEKSFPSNHALQAFMVATLFFGYYRRLGILLFLFAVIVSLGRIYLGVHYPSDVIGAAIIGTLLALMILKLNKMYKIKPS